MAKAKEDKTVEIDAEELRQVKALAQRYVIADPGKDVRESFLRRVAALGS